MFSPSLQFYNRILRKNKQNIEFLKWDAVLSLIPRTQLFPHDFCVYLPVLVQHFNHLIDHQIRVIFSDSILVMAFLISRHFRTTKFSECSDCSQLRWQARKSSNTWLSAVFKCTLVTHFTISFVSILAPRIVIRAFFGTKHTEMHFQRIIVSEPQVKK